MSATQEETPTMQQESTEASTPAAVAVDESSQSNLLLRQALASATHHLEQARCQHAELEAWTVLASALLKIPPGRQQDIGSSLQANRGSGGSSSSSSLPTGGLQDGWNALTEITAQGLQKTSSSSFLPPDAALTSGGGGQWDLAVHRTIQATSIQSMAQQASAIASARLLEGGPALQQALNTFAQVASAGSNNNKNDPNLWLKLFDERLDSLRAYHAKHDRQDTVQPVGKRPRLGNPAADGYDLYASVSQNLQSLQNEMLFTLPEVLGKYLDLQELYESSKDWFFAKQKNNNGNNTPELTTTKETSYVDFLQVLASGLDQAWGETTKLHAVRKHYFSFLAKLQTYLTSFLQRTAPLLSIEHQVEGPALKAFDKTWSQVGGYPPAWQAKPVEAILAQDVGSDGTATDAAAAERENSNPRPTIDLSQYNSATDLEQAVNGETLKVELARLGLKCGGTPKARAERLFLLKDTPWKDLPTKVFAKKPPPPATTTTTTTSVNKGMPSAAASNPVSVAGIRRIDLARRETVVMALLNQVQPTLEATLRKSERQLTQTLAEREREYQEELYGSGEAVQEKKKSSSGDDDDDDDDEEDDAPIYNPKNVPLDWDGKPIPYWLFKLHGLNHYYLCEICGGESYRGRRNFELHFAEQKHTMGMKSLGIPNTKHFHGVTKIEDAQQLWSTLKHKVEHEQFDGNEEEEYEDSHGNVLSRKTYEDLARQGLL